uniref:Uncharacterized protein n=1 Tax=Salix viminalis TaxID=40686 RepID=A0A6N2LEK4_SALVM
MKLHHPNLQKLHRSVSSLLLISRHSLSLLLLISRHFLEPLEKVFHHSPRLLSRHSTLLLQPSTLLLQLFFLPPPSYDVSWGHLYLS